MINFPSHSSNNTDHAKTYWNTFHGRSGPGDFEDNTLDTEHKSRMDWPNRAAKYSTENKYEVKNTSVALTLTL